MEDIKGIYAVVIEDATITSFLLADSPEKATEFAFSHGHELLENIWSRPEAKRVISLDDLDDSEIESRWGHGVAKMVRQEADTRIRARAHFLASTVVEEAERIAAEDGA
jgi:hypothetical protein